jgi:nitrogen fixation NifU-like protein
MPWYNDQVLEHFQNPRNAGVMEHPDGEALVSNPACGDTMKLHIKVAKGVIVDAKWQTRGCGSAIAASSVASEMIKGQSLEKSRKLTRGEISDALGGLPSAKVHCSVLASDALREAIEDYESKHAS